MYSIGIRRFEVPSWYQQKYYVNKWAGLRHLPDPSFLGGNWALHLLLFWMTRVLRAVIFRMTLTLRPDTPKKKTYLRLNINLCCPNIPICSHTSNKFAHPFFWRFENKWYYSLRTSIIFERQFIWVTLANWLFPTLWILLLYVSFAINEITNSLTNLL